MKSDKPAYSFIVYEENKRAIKMKTNLKRSSNSRKNNYTSDYELDNEREEKTVINEINRQNLTSDYGV